MKAVRALRKFISTAVFTESPELSNTAKSPLRQKAEKISRQSSRVFPGLSQKTTKASHPSRVGSRGTGWPPWSPCQSRLTRRRPPRQPGHRQSYEGCLPRLPSQPAGEPLVLGTQREPVSLRLILRPWQSLCDARRLITKHITFNCVVQLILKELTLTWRPPCVCVFRRYFCTLQVIHWSLQDTDNYSQHRFMNFLSRWFYLRN